ncbi:hypothetical protein JXJ21_05220 [candidate division KSB1 bacterium]|nr:hypothetical protein [candidate division KSB1 bacterium]
MQAQKYIGKVLPDGHLSLPEDTAKRIGEIFEVILLPVKQADIYAFTEKIAEEKGYSHLSEEDIERIVHDSRGIEN